MKQRAINNSVEPGVVGMRRRGPGKTMGLRLGGPKVRMAVLCVALLVCAGAMSQVRAQSVDKLRDEIARAEREIQRIDGLIRTNSKELKGTQKMISLVKSKIDSRQLIIRNMDTQIATLRKQLGVYGRDITTQSGLLETLIQQQKEQLRAAYMNYKTNNYTAFLFDSPTFAQSVRRLYYLDLYHRRVEQRSADIQNLRHNLEVKVDDLTARERELKALLASKAKEVKSLELERAELAAASKRLTGNTAKLRAEAAANRKKVAELQSRIKRIMEEEARLAAAEAARRRQQIGADKAKREYEDEGREFEKGKGVLLAPVVGGVVVEKFGVHEAPDQSGVKVDNKGVNVRCPAGATVRAVAEGEVRRVFLVPGMGSSVIVRHTGGYLTVYSNLASVSVAQGDRVVRGASVGKIGSADPTLHFQIWRETQILNPELWVRF